MSQPRRREPDTAKTRQKIIAATDALISKGGLAVTSVSAVARSLGMSHPNVYRHFKSKEELLIAVAETWMRETREASEAAFDASASTAQNLENLVMAIRSELLRRASNEAALDLYFFALKNMPEAAVAHHGHRAMLVDRIMGRPDTAQPILDALRGFTDPTLLIQTEAPDTKARVRSVCDLLARES